MQKSLVACRHALPQRASSPLSTNPAGPPLHQLANLLFTCLRTSPSWPPPLALRQPSSRLLPAPWHPRRWLGEPGGRPHQGRPPEPAERGSEPRGGGARTALCGPRPGGALRCALRCAGLRSLVLCCAACNALCKTKWTEVPINELQSIFVLDCARGLAAQEG